MKVLWHTGEREASGQYETLSIGYNSFVCNEL